MAIKIFFTGVTGYVGGDAFYALYKKHPEYEYTLLVRNEQRGKAVKDKYPDVHLAYGSLTSADVLEREAAAADVVIHMADSADDVPSATAIVKGLAAGHTPEKPGYYIHLCGTGLLTWYDAKHNRRGQAPIPEEKYGDITDIDRILNIPDEALHRDVDKVVIPANSPSVRIAIVGPPTIYGTGRGPVNTVSQQVPGLAKRTLERGAAPYAAPGLTEWDNVYVQDLSDFWVTLVEATQDPSKNADPEIFGTKAYYFIVAGTHTWKEVAEWVAEEAHKQGFLDEAKVVESDDTPASWGLNSKAVTERAKKYFGWTPKGPSLKETIADVVAVEAKNLGLQKKH